MYRLILCNSLITKLVRLLHNSATVDDDGDTVYHNSWITQHTVNSETCVKIGEAGRARWMIENGNNNTLKTKGYNFEHNFGHGKKHLSSLLATLNILAFLMHTVLDLTNKKYQLLRAALPSRKTFYECMRVLTIFMCFQSQENLLNFMIRRLKIEVPNTG